MPRRIYFGLAVVAALSAFCWQATQGAKPKDEMLELYGLFVDAVEKVEANYVRPVTRRELLESALEGMLQNLDQHSSFINTSEWKQFRKQIEGKFGGIGIQVGLDNDAGRLRVISPMVGTPAYEAGVMAGDLIMDIDGHSTEGMSPDKAVEVLTGRPGTEVTLDVLHEGSEQPEPIKLTRAIIEVPSVLGDHREKNGRWDYMIDKDKKIGYIRISSFIQNTAEELRKALDELKDQDAKALILDLRDNPGGLLSAAVEVSDTFLDKGDIVSTKGRNTIPKTYTAQKDSTYEDLPMVVLVNQNSASASEIVSAALQDHKRATIVGQRSYGKGSVQNILELEDGDSVLKLTVASYFRPSGENIHRFRDSKTTDKWGVSPDPGMEVKLKPTEYIEWFRGRRTRDLPELAKLNPKKHVEAKSDAEKAQDNKDKAESKDVEKKDKPPADPTKPAPPLKVVAPAADSHKFVDKVVDKALEVLKAKLAAPAPAEEAKAKAA
ncbi:S41 family peptidase [Paludisphaera borealis]|uniref:Carboxy-terminal processing protease CtpA n=1 Tax=Paludisphaera borealis TaxID=1387353 RepID=A0A1U7CUC3_9BACT|nr:S41 family peptidase [Paludisphaera borealis]APW62544.1 Carboxy-terminal processing protease CtpA [Paludisphaera borealis]